MFGRFETMIWPTILDKSLWDCSSTAIFIFFCQFLGSLLKQCILFKNFAQYSLPHTLYKVETQKKNLDTPVQYCLWGEWRGWTCVNWKTPQNNKSVPGLLSMIVVSGLIYKLSKQNFKQPSDIFSRKKTSRRIFNYKCGSRKKTLSNFLASSSSLKKANTGRPA